MVSVDSSRHGMTPRHATRLLKGGSGDSIGHLEVMVGNVVIEGARARSRVLIGGLSMQLIYLFLLSPTNLSEPLHLLLFTLAHNAFIVTTKLLTNAIRPS